MWTHLSERVATPLHRDSEFNAVRSPRSKCATGPVTVANLILPKLGTKVLPSMAISSHSTVHPPHASKTALKNGMPANIPGDFMYSSAFWTVVPTTYPPTSKWEGMSSCNHVETSALICGGGRSAECGACCSIVIDGLGRLLDDPFC